MDTPGNGYLDLKQLILILGIICSNRYTEKLKLLYILHLPPLLPRGEILTKKPKPITKEDMEIATEAEDFFSEDASESIEALPSPIDTAFIPPPLATNIEYPSSSSNATPNLSVGSSNPQLPNSVFYVDLNNDIGPSTSNARGLSIVDAIDTSSDISDFGLGITRSPNINYDEFSTISQSSLQKYEAKISLSSAETRSLNSLRAFFDQPDANFTRKTIPNMTQMNFIALWTSILELMGTKDNDVEKSCKISISVHSLYFVISLYFKIDR